MTAGKNFSVAGSLLFTSLLLSGCATYPSGPSVLSLPGTGMSLERFRYDDRECRQFANYQIGGSSAQQAANRDEVTSALAGTAIGAISGAAIGGSRGAAVGAGVGLVGGSLIGSDSSRLSGYAAQRQYDNTYTQCMYGKGHRVPVPANMASPAPVRSSEASIPPPPPGSPPPPPPPR